MNWNYFRAGVFCVGRGRTASHRIDLVPLQIFHPIAPSENFRATNLSPIFAEMGRDHSGYNYNYEAARYLAWLK
jgi:hypothetical protein